MTGWLQRGRRLLLSGRRDRRDADAPPPEESDPFAAWRAAADAYLQALERQGTGLHRSFESLADRVARLERHDRVRTMTGWIEHATLRTTPLVSVVMATRNRSEFFERSIGSLIAQQYRNWELVVVDDGGDDGATDQIAAFGDPRIVYSRIEPAGAGAARNHGLRLARGDLITYLDDDNMMHPLWLKAVVWAFEQRTDVDVLYGGTIIDDTARLHGEPGAELPSLWLEPFERASLAEHNVADMGAIAHRSGLEAAVFAEDLHMAGDWDLLLSLTADRDPLVLPVVALHYYSDAPRRLSNAPNRDRDFARIATRHAARARSR